MLKELTTSFKAILYERIVSPLSGAFLLSWIVINWKPVVLILLGKTPVLERINLIQKDYSKLDSLIIHPAIATAIIIFIYPWIANIAYLVWQKSLSFKIKTRIKYENSTPLTLEQSVELRKEIQKKDNEFNELLAYKNQEISDLKNNITGLNESLNEKEKNILTLTREFKDKERIIDNLNRQNSPKNNEIKLNNSESEKNTQDWHNEYRQRSDKSVMLDKHFEEVLDQTLGKSQFPLDDKLLRYFSSAGIVDTEERTGKLFLTDKGKYFANLWSIEND